MFSLLRQLRARLKYRHHSRDLAQELEIHRAMAQGDLEARGLSTADARPVAALALGNTTYAREEARSVWIARWIDQLRQDVRYTLVAFRRQPVFCIAVVSILAVGLGLVSTAHSVVDATFFRPWQVPNGAQVHFVRSNPTGGGDFGMMSFPELRYLQAQAKSVDFIGATIRSGSPRVFYNNEHFDTPQSLSVSANYFDLLGVKLITGRGFLPSEDDLATRRPVAVIGERLWNERFNRDPGVVGRGIRIGSEIHTVVGIAPADFLDPHNSRTEVWRPLTLNVIRTPDDAKAYADPRHRSFSYAIIAKVAAGFTAQQATAELNGLSGQFRKASGLPIYGLQLRDTRPGGGGDTILVGRLVLVALVLIQFVACANVGNLVLARAIGRTREVALRMSLGAGRGRLVRQLVTEVAVLALLAGVLGMGLAFFIPSIVVPWLPQDAPRAEFYWPRGNTFVTAFTMSVITALAAGLIPALRATRVNLSSLSGERHGPTVTAGRLQRGLLATQVAVAALLLAGAGIFTQAVGHAAGTSPGFAMRDFLEVSFVFSTESVGPRRLAFFKALPAALEGDGWPPLAYVGQAPMQERNNSGHFLRADPTTTRHFFPGRNVSDNYFNVIGVPLVAGRMAANGEEIVLNRTAASLLWPGESPLGRTVISGYTSRESQTQVVVGVAPDLPSSDFTRIEPVAYTPISELNAIVIVRSRDPRIGERFNELARRIDSGVTATARPLEASLEDVLFVPRIGSWAGWAIGGIGLTLAMIGAFGVFVQSVESRRREIGIRLALGAGGPQVVRLIVTKTQGAVAIGVAAGLIIAAIGAFWGRSFLYGLSPLDPVAYLQVTALLIASAALATWIPARRATRVNPADTLRAE